MRATLRRWGRGFAALAALIALSACTIGREPAYDAAIAGEVTGLTAETLALFQDFRPTPTGEHAERAERYRALAARAETIRLMAEARSSAVPPSGLARRFAALAVRIAGDGLPLPERTREISERLNEYNEATPAYMADYLRNLGALEAHDRAATGDQGGKIAAHQAALAAHRDQTAAYLDAFRLWQRGAGPQPAQPAPPPAAPRLGHDPDCIALRLTALEDILRDTLVYERDILNRAR
ncbi:MAG: hypothetical protein OEN23_19325 [Paracoccaceae bacterium]|nr:hypothetical protein [Paracoccaceae bacterium]